jgi:hypothetical protein
VEAPVARIEVGLHVSRTPVTTGCTVTLTVAGLERKEFCVAVAEIEAVPAKPCENTVGLAVRELREPDVVDHVTD